MRDGQRRQTTNQGLLCTLVAVSALSLASPPPAIATMCANDVVPAATLLLPYFEVDLGDTSGRDTVMILNNALPEPLVTQVTMWTDWGVPSISFNVFMTGYDVVEMSLQDVFAGSLPVTADEQTDPDDTISPHGDHPEWDGSFTGGVDCANIFPFPDPVVFGTNLDRLRNGHTGYPVASVAGCLGEGLNGSGQCTDTSCPEGTLARGYITVDVTNECSLTLPIEDGYFAADGSGIASNENALFGDFFLFDPDRGTLAGMPLVHLEAEDGFDADLAPNGYTFYGRYTHSSGGNDNREPLGSVWDLTYAHELISPIQTDWLVWRDTTIDQKEITPSYSCGSGAGTGPAWNPLPQERIRCWSAFEDVVELCDGTDCLPLASQRLAEVSYPFDAGWCRLELNIPQDTGPGDVDFPAAGGPLAQGWVGALDYFEAMPAGGGRQGSLAFPSCLPSPYLFGDDFESGGTSAWN